MNDQQLNLLKEVASFDGKFQSTTANRSPELDSELIKSVDELFALTYDGSSLDASGAADYGDWLASERGQLLVSHDPRALENATFSDVMFAWVVLNRAGHWVWEDEDYLESIKAGVFAALTSAAANLVRKHQR